MEDLKPVALAPGPDGTPNFSFPNVFDLSDSEGYYQTVVVPRQQRQMSRMLHKQLHDQNLKAKKAAGPVEEEDTKPGKAPKLNLKESPTPKSAYPAEASRSVEHAPKDPKTGKPICWDAATHMGCQKGSKCPHAHEPLPGLAKLDYAAAMQVIRRGGLKGSQRIDPKEVDGRVAQLRSQAQADRDEKKQDPKPKPKPKPKVKAKTGKDEASEEERAREERAGSTQWVVPGEGLG